MAENGTNSAASQVLLEEETKKYLESHPELVEQLRTVEKAYRIFGEYINLTQSRIIVRESGASTTEADLSAALLRTDL